MGFFSRLFRRGEKTKRATPAAISKEDALAAYIVREHREGRSLEDILDDPYLKNRATDEQRLRLLDRPEVIRAVGEDTAAMAAEHVRES
jgi:rRNA maturation protein Nop10